MRRVLLSVVFVGLCSMLFFKGTYAQTPDEYEESYAEQAIEDIRAIQAAYVVTRDYLGGDQGTIEDVEIAWSNLEALEESLLEREPPVSTLGIHQQLLFTIQRCSNYVGTASSVTSVAKSLKNPFFTILEEQGCEFCAVQINAAKLRLIDYGSANDVNLFTDLSAPIVITYTMPVSSTTSITTSAAVTMGFELIDDLGKFYEVNIPGELTLLEWTAYVDANGRVEFFGEVEMAEDAEPFDDVPCIVRFYSAGRLIDVVEIVNVGYGLDPGGKNSFTGETYLEPSQFDSYEVTFEVSR
jgi:hypothetical protein